ncbi:MAG: NADH-quinone oxidoreductase subunit J [Candidatus Eiseniibacteriota bacterium]|nr:MAG: NADH-quinone oxidoreductase subunit J [Candidatus Eisenbacteria bacterium]
MSDIEFLNAPLVFKMLAALALLFAVLSVTLRNVFHCALALAAMFILLSGVFVLLDADFLAVVQVLIYVGAVVILMIFAIVLTEKITSETVRQTNQLLVPGFLVCVATLAGALYVLTRVPWPSGSPAAQKETIKLVGTQLLSTHLEAFEVASVLLLAALVGAVFLGKEITRR